MSLAPAPDPESEHPINVFISQYLVADVKALRYGWNGDLSYSSCHHHGISPFAITTVTAEQASSHRRPEDRLSRVTTTLTTQDLERTKTSPSQISTDYNGFWALLHSYFCLLRVLFETECTHYGGVCGLHMVLVQN
jgi:hypothetical protein